jgi:hypothetical protein
MVVAQEEVFGPVAPKIKADDEREAIKLQMIQNLVLVQEIGLKIKRKQKNFH